MQHHSLPRRKYWHLHPPSSFLGLFSALWAMKEAKFLTAGLAQKGHAGQEALTDEARLDHYLPFLFTMMLGTHWHGLACNRVAILFLQHQLVPFLRSDRNSAIALYTWFWTVASSSFSFRDFCVAIYMYNAQLQFKLSTQKSRSDYLFYQIRLCKINSYYKINGICR